MSRSTLLTLALAAFAPAAFAAPQGGPCIPAFPQPGSTFHLAAVDQSSTSYPLVGGFEAEPTSTLFLYANVGTTLPPFGPGSNFTLSTHSSIQTLNMADNYVNTDVVLFDSLAPTPGSVFELVHADGSTSNDGGLVFTCAGTMQARGNGNEFQWSLCAADGLNGVDAQLKRKAVFLGGTQSDCVPVKLQVTQL